MLLAVGTHFLDIIGSHSLSLVMRIGYWRSGWEIWRRHPLLGIGSGNFHHYYYTYKSAWVEEVNKAHNCYWQWSIETGLIGMTVLLFFIWALACRLHKSQSRPAVTTDPASPEDIGRCSGYLLPAAALFSFILLWLLGYFFEYDSVRSWLIPCFSGLGTSASKVSAALLSSLIAVTLMGLWFAGFFLLQEFKLARRARDKMGVIGFCFP